MNPRGIVIDIEKRDGEEWCLVEFDDGTKKWIPAEELTKVKPN